MSDKPYAHLSDEHLSVFHAACEAFERSVYGDRQTSIEDQLRAAPDSLRSVLIHELLSIELEWYSEQNESPTVDDYLNRFPEHQADIRQAFKEAKDSKDNVGERLDVARDEAVGSMIGPYKLRELIGEGGMGLVYAAEQQGIRRNVALKIIKPGLDTKEVIARFEAERQALALMDHRNIARVLDIGATEAGRPYFVMELIRGIPITEYCDKHKLSTRKRLELMVQVCQALQHAHQKGIIHRDIKPTNILVTFGSGFAVPKVIDFGVAKAINQRLTERTIYTQMSQLIGTPMYMSPEQAEQSAEDVDTRTDIYSLGVVLYELLTGTTPFSREQLSSVSYDEMRRIIREQDPPRPSQRLSTLDAERQSAASEQRAVGQLKLMQTVPGELDWIAMKAMEKVVTRRYESAGDFASDIQRYLADETVLACPPSASYRLSKFARRNKIALAIASLVIGGLLVSNILITQQRNAAETQQQRADENFDRARQAVDRYFTLVSETKLLDEPGLIPLRRELIENAVEFYQSSLDRGNAAPDMMIELANIRLRLGVMDLALASGDAISEFEKAFDLVEQLLNQLPVGDPVFRRLAGFYPGFRSAMNASYKTAGDASAEHRQDAVLLRGAALWSRFASAHPEVSEFRRDLVLLLGYVRWQTRGKPVDLEHLRDLVKQHPEDKQLLAELAFVIYARGYIKEDADLLREAIDKLIEADLPAHGDVLALWHHRLGWRLLENGDSAQAAVELQESVSMFRELAKEFPHIEGYDLRTREFTSDLARALRKSGQVSEAEQLASDLPLRTGSDFVLKGNIFRVLGDVDKAIAEYNHALEVGLQGEIPHTGRVAEFLDKHKQHEKAILFFDQGVRTTGKPNVSRLLASRGACRVHLKQFNKALADFTSAIEINAWQCEHHLSRMLPRMMRESPADFQEEFLKLADRAIEITEGSGQSYITRSVVLYALGQTDESKEDLARGLELEPDYEVHGTWRLLMWQMKREIKAESTD